MDTAMAFFRSHGEGRFEALEHARGPWSDDHLHAGPPTALMNRVARGVGEPFPTRRITVELRAPVPLDLLETRAEITRSGRQVECVRVQLLHRERVVAEAQVLKAREVALESLPSNDAPAPHFAAPEDSEPFVLPFFRHPVGYQTAMELRIAAGRWGKGPVTAWMRMRGALIEGETPAPIDVVLAAADSGNGISPLLDPDVHSFANADLSVHLVADPPDEWVALEARMFVRPSGAGMTQSTLWGRRGGPIGVAAQTLIVRAR
jgi:hypothetical protein